MSIFRYKQLINLILLASFATFLGVYLYMIPPEPEKKPQTAVVLPPEKIVEAGTDVYIAEIYTTCEKYDLSCRTETLLTGNARQELAGKSENEVLAKYPREAGWNVVWEGKRLQLEQKKPGLCPDHQKRWHLGVEPGGEKLAVYLGPGIVGQEGGIYKNTDLIISRLPADIQEKIKAGTMEFIDLEDLIATLDSLGEYGEE